MTLLALRHNETGEYLVRQGDVAIGDRFTRSYPASPGHDGPAVVRQVAISADGTHVAWLAVHGSGVGLYLDGQAVFETGPGDRIFERTLGFTAGGELVAVVQRAGRNALVYGSDRYPLPSNSRVHLRLAPVGERGVRLAEDSALCLQAWAPMTPNGRDTSPAGAKF